MNETEIVFLGTGGGRFSMITQKRQTGGIRILNPLNIQIDPGPGAIVYSNQIKLNPMNVKALMISHAHPDHYGDAEIFIEAMTKGMTKKNGYLIAPKSVIRGSESHEPSISKYHKKMIDKIYEVSPGENVHLEKLDVRICKAKHTDPCTVGFRFAFSKGNVAYISDTEYFEGIENQYKDSRVVIISVLRPRNMSIRGHLCTDDAVRILEQIRPEFSIITAFGMRMIFANPSKEARYIQEKSGVKTIAAYDSMHLKIADKIKFIDKSPSLDRFLKK
jgi:phosphoribosyl 1,2-cyclic phosphodiesterase